MAKDPRLVIRPARSQEAGLILALVRELAAYERLEHEVDADEAGYAHALFGPSPRAFCDLAVRDGEVAGLALWFYSFSTFRGRHGIYLEDLFVRPAFRRHGIGQALLRRLARRCKTEGLARLEWSVLNWNEPALRFYRTLGAEPIDGWTVNRLTDAALDRLALEDEAEHP